MDWVEWHDGYEEADSWMGRRLVVVQGRIREALDGAAPGEVRVLSMCAGQGRDLLGVLEKHPRRADVTGRLVELDPRNVELARESAPGGVEVVRGDAGVSDAYDGIVPVDLALVCGVFGNVSDEDIRRTVEELPRLCRPGATVIWTRHREGTDITPSIRAWFTETGFEELGFDVDDAYEYGVGTNRLVGPALPYRRANRMFTFIRPPDR